MYKDKKSQEVHGPSAEPNDVALLVLVGEGDEHAMALLFDRYSKVVYTVALRVLRDPTSAEDVLQEVFMRIWRTPDRFMASRGNLGAWLAVVSRNRSIDELRRKRPTEQVDEMVLPSSYDLAAEAEHNVMMDKVRIVVQELPSKERDTIEMAFFHGLTHSEIAVAMGDPLGTVKTRMRRGLSTLKGAFQSIG